MDFSVYLNSSQSISPNTLTQVKYDTVVRDPSSGYSSVTGLYTVPSGGAGLWLVTASADQDQGVVSGQWWEHAIFINGVQYSTNEFVAWHDTYSHSMPVSGIFSLNVGDTIGCKVQQNNGTPTLATSREYTFLQGKLL